MQGRKGKVVYKRDGTKRYEIDGREVTERQFKRAFPSRLDLAQGAMPHMAASYNLRSEALAVAKEQIPEAAEFAKKRGVPTAFDQIGRPIFTSRDHRRKYMKIHGHFDKDGGYGDG